MQYKCNDVFLMIHRQCLPVSLGATALSLQFSHCTGFAVTVDEEGLVTLSITTLSDSLHLFVLTRSASLA